MSDATKDQSRVNRPTYWMYYLGITVLCVAMYGWGLYEFIKLHLTPIVFGFVAPFILSIYLRVIAMRRCNDIGWPTFLPWLTLALTISCGFIGGLQTALHHTSPLGVSGVVMGISMLLGVADFIFLIVIGCVPGRADGSDVSFHGHDPRGPMRAARNHAGPGQRARPLPRAFDAPEPPFGSAPQSSPARPTTGFGRRGL